MNTNQFQILIIDDRPEDADAVRRAILAEASDFRPLDCPRICSIPHHCFHVDVISRRGESGAAFVRKVREQLGLGEGGAPRRWDMVVSDVDLSDDRTDRGILLCREWIGAVPLGKVLLISCVPDGLEPREILQFPFLPKFDGDSEEPRWPAFAARLVLDRIRFLVGDKRLAPDSEVRRTHSGKVLGVSRAIRDLYDLVERFALFPYPIVIEGESGAGKELVAHELHAGDPRRKGKFVVVNCAVIPQTLIASELFGTTLGAFSGAEPKEGLFGMADGGTLFLDEVHHLPLDCQAALLRVVEDGEVRKVGGTTTRHVNVKVVLGTSRHLDDEVDVGRFDAALRNRFQCIRVPRLADRAEDIPYLAQDLVKKIGNDQGVTLDIDHEAVAWLQGRDWPGNVRELELFLKRTFVISGDQSSRFTLTKEHLERADRSSPRTSSPVSNPHDAWLARTVVQTRLPELDKAMDEEGFLHWTTAERAQRGCLALAVLLLYQKMGVGKEEFRTYGFDVDGKDKNLQDGVLGSVRERLLESDGEGKATRWKIKPEARSVAVRLVLPVAEGLHHILRGGLS